jgi:hypothetical protein
MRPTERLGRDGRVRPLNTAEGRRSASEFIAANPEASLRTIARCAGISLGTARDVRERVRRGMDPVPDRQRRPAPTVEPSRKHFRRPFDPQRMRDIVTQLGRDPSLRFTEAGRGLLRWCHARMQEIEARDRLIERAPDHSSYLLIEFAECYADSLHAAAERVRVRLDDVA